MAAIAVTAMYMYCFGCLEYCILWEQWWRWVGISFCKGYQYSSVMDRFRYKQTSLSGRLTDLEDGVCKAPSSGFYGTDSDICLDASFCVQQTRVYRLANGMSRVRCEQPVCCLLSIRPTHVQFSQVWHVKQRNMLPTCQTLLTDLGRETQNPYKINKPKLYSCSFLIKGQAYKDVHTCTRNNKNDCYSCHFPSTEGLLPIQLHYFNRHQDLNIARTHYICALCTAVFTANISPHSL